MKVLLVDDEVLTITMLQNLIPWQEMGLELMGYAKDGFEAYDMVIKDPPDIIISDIKMSGMSGIDLLKKVMALSFGIRTILMSAYADFSYAKEAIKLGCCYYILKPIDELELEQALRNVKEDILGAAEHERVISKSAKQLDKIHLYQYMKTSYGLNKVLSASSKSLLDFKKYAVFMIQAESGTIDDYNHANNLEMIKEGHLTALIENVLSEQQLEGLVLDYDEGLWTVILNLNENITRESVANQLVDNLRQMTDIMVNACFSSVGTSIEQLPVLYDEVKNLYNYNLYIEGESVFGYDYNCNLTTLSQARDGRIFSEIEQALGQKDIASVRKTLDEAFDWISEGDTKYFGNLRDLCFKTIVDLRKIRFESDAISLSEKELYDITYQDIAEINTTKDLKRKVYHIIDELFGFAAGDFNQSYSKSVNESIEIIQNRYNENLSLNEICQDVAVSKNHFCYLFKRETGMNLWKYLTIIRLQHAKQLLENTDLRSYEIAFRVGYDNPSYFSKLFKKYENMTPNEYRENKKRI